MRNWVAKLFTWRERRGAKILHTANRGSRRNRPSLELLEDRLAPAIASLPPLGEGLNMPRFPIEEQVRAATGRNWSAISIAIATPTADASFNHNILVTGSVAPAGNDQVTLRANVDSGTIFNVPVNSSQFSFSTALGLGGLADGSHTVTLTARDQSGRATTKSVAFKLDTKAPTISAFDLDASSDSSPAGDHTTTFSTVTLKGKTEAGVTVVLSNTGATTTADASGNFTFSGLTLAAGATTFTVKATDAAGNTASKSQIITRTVVALAVTVNDKTTNDTTPTITGTVTDPQATISISVGGQTVNATISTTDNTWSATVPTALAAGTFPITVTATRGTETKTDTGSLVIDTTAPTISLTSTPTSPTNGNSVVLTVTFNEAMTGFVQSDIVVPAGQGTLSQFVASSDSKTFTATLTPTADGTVNVSIAAGAAQDPAGNNNPATSLAVVFDRAALTATLNSTTTGPTSTNPVPLTITFNKPVTDFTSADLTFTNGTLGTFTANSSTSYTITVIPTTPNFNGSVGFTITAGSVHDSAGNAIAAATFTRNFDNVLHSPAITFGVTSPTKSTAFQATVLFDEVVTGFALSDLDVVNGTPSALVAGSDGKTYSFTVTPQNNGPVTVTLKASSVQDAANNTNAATASAPIVFDNVAPTVSINTTATSPTQLTSIPFTIDFSEVVSTLTLANVHVTNGHAAAAPQSADSQHYTVDIIPDGDGTVIVEVVSNAVSDPAGNGNVGNSKSIVVDVPPLVSFSAIPSPTNSTSIVVTITFSENVTGFSDDADILVTNGSHGPIAQTIDAKTYTTTITPLAAGLVTIQVIAGAAQGVGSLPNVANSTSFTFDNTPPVATLDAATSGPTATAPVSFTMTFDQAVTDFTSADLTFTNGTLGTFTPNSPTSYTVTVVPTASFNGDVSVNITAGSVHDAAGNPIALTTFTRAFDNTPPVATLDPSTSGPTATAPVSFTINFDQAVTDFTSADLTFTNGTLGTFTPNSSTSYTVTVIPTASFTGDVSVKITAGSVHDAAGNAVAATTFTRAFDNTPPVATLDPSTSGPTSSNPITFTIKFDEPVTDFSDADLTFTNGTLGTFTPNSSTSYTVTVIPSASFNGDVSVVIGAGSVHDALGNAVALTTLTRAFDNTAPTAALDPSTTGPTSSNPIPFTLTFSEPVTDFTAADLTFTNGTLGTFTPNSPTSYTVTVIPSSNFNGDVGVSIGAGSVHDAVGNPIALTSFTRTFDNTAPTAVIDPGVPDPTNQSATTVTVTFDEDVLNFTDAGIQLTGATLVPNSFVMQDSKTYKFNITMAADGPVKIDVLANAAHDLAGNTNVLISKTITRDTVGPTPTVTTNVSSPTNLTLYTFTVDFVEEVTGFDINDIVVTNGQKDNFVPLAGGHSFTVDVTPDGPGEVKVDVPAAVAKDTANNDNLAGSGSVTFTP